MTIVALASGFAGVILVGAIVATGIRLVRGPSLPDRIIAIDLLGLLTACVAAVAAVFAGHAAYLDVAVGITILAFLATLSFAGLLERIRPWKVPR